MTLETEMLAERPNKPSRRIGLTHDAKQHVVAIIGAGFSGTMAAIHLRHMLPADHVIYLFDRTGRFARGPAYAASDSPHLLNVRSVNMSAFPDDPGHFERWLAHEGAHRAKETVSTEAGLFATRRLYGRYLRALLYQEIGASGGRVRLGADDVATVSRHGAGWRLQCSSGREVIASGIVLAIGNLPSKQACDGVIYYDPWAYEATVGLRPDEPVLIVGTGLTMIDLALGMRTRGFAGPIIAMSRRGLVPQRHTEVGPAWPCPVFTPAERASLPRLVRRLRREIEVAAGEGYGWRAVIDGLRPATAGLWRGLPEPERNRFLRHLRPHWDSHRHRLAPASAVEFDALLADGGLRIKRGRVQSVTTENGRARVVVQDHGVDHQEILTVQRVIYATGAGAGTASDGFVASLVRAGLARTDRHGMGLEVTEALQVIGDGDIATPRAWALGPIVRGVFWECTAVPDIRVQARTIATEVTRQLVPASVMAE